MDVWRFLVCRLISAPWSCSLCVSRFAARAAFIQRMVCGGQVRLRHERGGSFPPISIELVHLASGGKRVITVGENRYYRQQAECRTVSYELEQEEKNKYTKYKKKIPKRTFLYPWLLTTAHYLCLLYENCLQLGKISRKNKV